MFAVELNRVTKIYKKDFKTVKALDRVSFKIPNKSIFSIIGPNGAGKTTCLKIITGISLMDEGKMKILGSEILDTEKKKLIGFLPENPSFFSNITPDEFLKFVLFTSKGKISDEKIKKILNIVGLYDERKEKVRKFSKGMIQRLGIAQAIIHEPEIIILDEPFSGLDPPAKDKLTKIILSLYDKGNTIILSSHNLLDVEELSTHITMIKQGKVKLFDDISSLRKKAVYEIIFYGDLKNWKKIKIDSFGNKKSIIIENKKLVWEFINTLKEKNMELISIRLSLKDYLENYYL